MKNLKLTRRQTADSVSSGVSLCGCYVIPEFFIRAVAALILKRYSKVHLSGLHQQITHAAAVPARVKTRGWA